MKKIILYLIAIALVIILGAASFPSTDVGELLPVQTLLARQSGQTVTVVSDDGLTGTGTSWEKAVSDLKQTAPGVVFLETAERVLVANDSLPLITEILDSDLLRPSCQIYLSEGDVSQNEKLNEFLRTHRTEQTLLKVKNTLARSEPLLLDTICQVGERLKRYGA